MRLHLRSHRLVMGALTLVSEYEINVLFALWSTDTLAIGRSRTAHGMVSALSARLCTPLVSRTSLDLGVRAAVGHQAARGNLRVVTPRGLLEDRPAN